MPVTSTLRLDLTARETASGAAVGQSISVLRHTLLDGPTTRSDGTASGDQDLAWSDSATVTAGAPVALDLSAGLTSVLTGAAISFAAVTAVCVRNRSSAGSLELGATVPIFGAASDSLTIPPGGLALLTAPVDGWPVTPATNDTITIAAQLGSVAYDLILLGQST
jgi:hypothetical protein